ncbi:uncharacterized protein tasor2 isoform X2 [Parambassis ranga]|uniref:Uncharacterized protein tasor2 isoform X2 n=1 Tax=Parambassis ranga TaxID=210632 RepID=A0A6P7KDU5_9TELE|nr:uncharacterized protein LOC114451793 isoform X2 [Parambassis ranga]
MESGNGGASSKGVLIPVLDASDDFQTCILAPLQSAYLYEESKQFFKYKSAVLVKNPTLEEKYNTFRANRRQAGYTEEDLNECFGFLLFDDVDKAHALGETGVLTGNGTCTTLGDPSKGVYISMYSDCLDQNHWYNGKTGYIAIIRLTKGKVKRVSENYTQNFMTPSDGFDCHVSEQLPSVSAKTSSFLAFERTQYYVYELLDDGSNKTAQCPSATCPFGIVSFSYTDTKATPVIPQEKSEVKETVCHYLPWSGELQLGSQIYSVGLRSMTTALIPAKLPPVLKCNQAISMVDLQKVLPRTVFEACITGEVFLDSLYCSLYELVSTEVEKNSSFNLLLCAIKEKDLALTIPLNDGGFLILLHTSHFLTYDDAGSSAAEVLQVLFVFPSSRVIVRDTKCGRKNPAISSEILRFLPVLSYAEGEEAKTPFDPNKELCEVLTQHMQNYAVLINPGLALSPSREVSIFPDQYDVPDAYKHLYSSPEWTNNEWQSLKSYLSKPASFQLPLSKASEIMSAGREEQREEFDDDVYICLSSPEAPANAVNVELEDQLPEQSSPVHVATSVDSGISAETRDNSIAVPQNFVMNDLQAGDASKDAQKCCDLTEQNNSGDKVEENLLTPTSDDLPAELIVSITSAEHSVTDETLSAVSPVATAKYNEFQLSDFSTRAKLQAAEVTSLSHDTDRTKKVLDHPEVTSLTKQQKKLRRGPFKGRKKAPGLKTVTAPVETDGQKETDGSLDNLHLRKPAGIHSRKLQKHKRILGRLSSKTRNLRSAAVGLVEPGGRKSDKSLESTILKELEAYPLRRKTERWDLKPVISECGRILVPHGSVDIVNKIQSLKDKLQSTKDEQCPDKMLFDAPVSPHVPVKMDQNSTTAPEMVVDKVEGTVSKDGESHLQNNIVSDTDKGSFSVPLSPETNQHSSKKDSGTDNPPSQAIEESSGKSQTHYEFLLGKLKSVLLKGKRKTECLLKEETANTSQNTEPCLKKGKVDTEELNCNTAATKDTCIGVKEISNKLSVDPLFAYALGLTPKETSVKVQKTVDAQQRKDLTKTPEQTISDQTEIIQKPPSIFPRGCRIKTLKKHQGISAEFIKQKCTPFQVSPVSGSTGFLHHQQTVYGDGFSTLHPSVRQENRSAQNSRTPEYLKKLMLHKQKFRDSRTFVDKDGSVQVTRKWPENYDFSLDSKFTCDSKDRTVIRALHGPWDFSIQDTSEEVRLIVHMWIGLFYSRSTARFFHVDSNITESSSLEIPRGVVSGSANSDPKANSFDSFQSGANTSVSLTSSALDLSKRDIAAMNQESVILDLSLRNSNAEDIATDPQVSRKETLVTSGQKKASERLDSVTSPKEEQAVNTFQCYRKLVQSAEVISLVKNGITTLESNKAPQTDVCLKRSDIQPLKSDWTFILSREGPLSASVELNSFQTASAVGQVLHGCYTENTVLKDGTETSKTREVLQKDGTDLSTPVVDEVKHSSKDADIMGHTHGLDKTESKNQEHCDRKENQSQEGSVDVSHVGEGSDDEKQIPKEEPMAVSPCQADNVNGSEDRCTIQEDEDRCNDKDRCISAMEVDRGSSHQPLPMSCDDQDSVKEDRFKESDHQAPMDLHADSSKVSGCDIMLKTLNINGIALRDQSTMPDKPPQSPSEMNSIQANAAAEENSEDKSTDETAVCHESASLTLPPTTESVETENQSKEMPDTSPALNVVHEEQDTELTGGEEKTNNSTPIDVALLEKTNEALDKSCRGVLIPFIGENIVQPPSQDKAEEVIQGLEQKTCISKATDPDAVQHSEACSMPEGSHEISLPDASETTQLMLSENEFDNRCPTPTIDEQPYEYIPCSTLGRSTSVFGGSETSINSLSRSSTPVKDELPFEQNHCDTPTVDSNSSQYQGLHADVELRTLRVLQSIDEFLSNSNYTNKSTRIETHDMKESLHQMSKSNSKCTPTFLPLNQIALNFKDIKNCNETLAVVTQDLQTESSDHFLISPFKSKLEEVLGVKLQLKKADSAVSQHYFERTDKPEASSEADCHLYRSLPSAECLQAIKPNIEQDWHKTVPQSNLNHEPRPYSQRPVMAVKPSKSEEGQADLNIEKSPKNKPPQMVTHITPASALLEKENEILSGHSEDLNNDGLEDRELSCPSLHHQGSDISKHNSPSPSLSIKSFETAKCSPKLVDGDQGQRLFERVRKENVETVRKDCSDLSASFSDHKHNSIRDDGPNQAPQNSLVCTVYNSSRKRSYSFLENLSQRCLQEDITQSSVEQECLIFSEQMKQILKRLKRGSGQQQDTHDSVTLSCTSPVTVQFSSLDEQEDSLDHLDMSLIGQKFKVDMSDRRHPADATKEEKNILNPQESSQGMENPMEHAGVSGVTAECASMYEAAMDDVCAVRKLPSQPKGFRIPNTELSNHFDFCDQMKREMDEAFLSNLNSVVKKSCKTKYRFYVLATTDDVFFEETKAQLEAEGHTSVQPPEFFLGEDSSSSLLIILRNEDIAEHICEIPHLLKLKKSPSVQFAGIDQPNDVVNLTHQELFIRGGFIMFDRAALETLSLCNMKKVFDILRELNRSGKWKWMLHYRDSRRLKENARFNEEAKEKKQLLYWGQDAGILGVLPYHECDQMSRPQPDYLTCLARLQIQNISSRYPVFITDVTTDSAFEKNGIFTLTLNSFLTESPSEIFTV